MKKLKSGDIFKIHTEVGNAAYAQILVSQISLYVCVFEPLTDPDAPVPDDLGKPLFIGWTNDAWFYHKRWKVLENRKLPDGVRVHIFSVWQGEKKFITDFRGRYIQQVDPELENLPENHLSESPIAFVKALDSYVSGTLEERFERILYRNVEKETRWPEHSILANFMT